jgi:hypothetical protein
MSRGLFRVLVLAAALAIALASWLLRGRGDELASACFIALATALCVGLGTALWTGKVPILFNSSVVVRRREEAAAYWIVLFVVAAAIAISLFSALTMRH